MTWERILKGDEIRKEEGDIQWKMLEYGSSGDSSISWINYPEGVLDTDYYQTTELIIKGSWRLHPPRGFIEGYSSCDGIILKGEIELMYDDDYENAPKTDSEWASPTEILNYEFDEDFEIEGGLGLWQKGELNPSYIDLTVDMKKSKNPDDWEITIDSLDWDVVE